MPHVAYAAEFDAPLAALWAFHEDVKGSLPRLTPPGERAELVSAEPLPPRIGTIVVLRARILPVPVIGWKKWVVRIAEHRPPAADGQAWFTDVQESGPFAAWRHRHLMESLGQNRSRLTDEINYTPPLGPLGRLADKLLIRRKLDQMFTHRHAETRRAVEGEDRGQ